MPDTPDVRAVGDRIQTLVQELGRSSDPVATERAGELVRLLMELYGAALGRIVGKLGAGSAPLDDLLEDELVSSLLVLHGLHPASLEARLQRAVETLQPGVTPFGVLRFVRTDGCTVHLQFEQKGKAPGFSATAVRLAASRAIEAAAPEIGAVEIEGLPDPQPEPQLLRFVRSPREAGSILAGVARK